jgi:nucleotide-binding universal stress UspA family protein
MEPAVNATVIRVDHTLAAEHAAFEVAALAARTGQSVHLVMAVRPPYATSARSADSDRRTFDSIGRADETLRALAGAIGTRTAVTYSVVIGRPARAVRQEAVRLGASTVIDGSRSDHCAARTGRPAGSSSATPNPGRRLGRQLSTSGAITLLAALLVGLPAAASASASKQTSPHGSVLCIRPLGAGSVRGFAVILCEGTKHPSLAGVTPAR